MRQQDFESKHLELWQRLEAFFNATGKKKSQQKSPVEIDPIRLQAVEKNLPSHYRLLCHHLAIAKHRCYSPSLVERLNRIVVSCHNLLYAQNSRLRYRWAKFFLVDFPQTLRRNRRYILLATSLFVMPALVMGLLCYFDPEMIYSVMNWSDVRNFEDMYDPANRILGEARNEDTDMAMFGHYINNNIGIAFRTFGGGVLFGIGTLFFTIYNGVILGAVFGHITQVGYIETFYGFVVGHGSFELTALVLSSAAGLRLGAVLLNPRSLTRSDALKLAARDVIQIVLAAGFMLLIAAFIEAFWSSKGNLPFNLKVAVGVFLWIAVLGYLLFVGQQFRRAEKIV